jgi:phage tail-like protein
MTSFISFTGFSPEHPAGRDFDLWKRVPRKNREEDLTLDLRRFIGCEQEIVYLLLLSIDKFVDLFDPDNCTDETIDMMLEDMGNPFVWADLELTANQRRKLLLYLLEIYKLKGTKPGIENTVLFLLGVDCSVVDYAAEGWVLGVDELGDGAIAQIGNFSIEPYDFTTVPFPLYLTFSVDGFAGQIVSFVPSDFDDPTAATAAEVVAVIENTLVGAGAYVVDDGEGTVLVGGSAPFPVLVGDTFKVKSQGVQYNIAFHAEDLVAPGSATEEEVLRVLTGKIPGVAPRIRYGSLELASSITGAISILESINDPSNTGGISLGFGLGTTDTGGTGHRLYVYSKKSGRDASIEMTTPGESVDLVLNFVDAESGTGGSVLATDDSRTLYSFDIEVHDEIDEQTVSIIRRIAEYMKPAHTHLVAIRPAPPLPWPEGWQIGVDELALSTELFG